MHLQLDEIVLSSIFSIFVINQAILSIYKCALMITEYFNRCWKYRFEIFLLNYSHGSRVFRDYGRKLRILYAVLFWVNCALKMITFRFAFSLLLFTPILKFFFIRTNFNRRPLWDVRPSVQTPNTAEKSWKYATISYTRFCTVYAFSTFPTLNSHILSRKTAHRHPSMVGEYCEKCWSAVFLLNSAFCTYP